MHTAPRGWNVSASPATAGQMDNMAVGTAVPEAQYRVTACPLNQASLYHAMKGYFSQLVFNDCVDSEGCRQQINLTGLNTGLSNSLSTPVFNGCISSAGREAARQTDRSSSERPGLRGSAAGP